METQAQSEAERMVIGSLFAGGCKRWELLSVSSEDFSSPVASRIWKATNALCCCGILPDVTMAIAEAKFSDEDRKTLAPTSFVSNAINENPTDNNLAFWVEKLKGCLIDNRMNDIRSLSQKRLLAGDDAAAVCEWINDEERKIKARYSMGDELKMGDDCYSILKDAVDGKRPEGIIYTGIKSLDHLCGGLVPGEYAVLAARPSCGKTSMVLNIMIDLARRGIKSTFFSLEMGRKMIAASITGIITQVSGRKLLREPHKITAEESARIVAKGGEVMQLSNMISVHARTGMKASEMANIARKEVRTGTKFLAMDHVQLTGENAENEALRISKFSKAWNAILKENNVPGVALCQLNRESVKENREPRPSDLKQSGSLEEDADVIWFIHPPKGIITTSMEKVKIIQSKGRTCGVGVSEAWLNGPLQTFSEVETGYVEEPVVEQNPEQETMW